MTIDNKIPDEEFRADDIRTRTFDISPLPIVVMDGKTLRYIDCNPAAVKIYGYESAEAVIGRQPIDFSAPVQYDGTPSPEKGSFYIDEACRKGSIVFEWLHQRPDGVRWDAEVHLFSFRMNDRTLLQFSLIDITGRKTAEQIQRTVHDLVLDLNSCMELQDGLEKVLDAVLQFGGVDCGGIYTANPCDNSLNVVAHRGLSDRFVDLVKKVSADAPNVRDASTGECRYGTYAGLRNDADSIRNNEGLRGFALLPIMAQGKLIALLNLASHEHDEIPGAVRNALETVAYQIGGSLLRLRTEAARRLSEERLSAFMDAAADSFYLLDSTLNFVEINRRALEFLGITRENVVGRNIADIVPDIKSSGRYDKHLEVIRTGEPFVVEDFIPHPRFGDVHFVLTSFRVGDGLGVIAHDITDRKKAEVALQQSERQFRALFMSLSEGWYLSEILRDHAGSVHDYLYLEVNPQFERIIGLPRDQLVGKRYHEIVPVDTTEWLQNYRRLAETGEPSTYSFYSDEYAMHFETYAYKTSENQICVFVRDVTERKKIESTLQNVQKLESLGLLAGGIAHDFNNLLGGVFGYIDLAAIQTDEPDVKEFLAKAMGAIDRARGLTQQLLTFAKGGAPVKKRDRVVQLIQDTVRFALSGSKCSCEFTMPSDLWSAEFDRDQIGQVLDNIVINAQQAMPLGGTIEVSARNITVGEKEHAVLKAGSYVVIAITDYGIGIPKEMIPRIFDPFFTTKPTGHGLGLATCYSIINRHGGCIDVESRQGKGSTFSIFLPALPGATAGSSDPEAKHHSGSGRILIMDDESVIRDVLGGMLEAFGYSVLKTASGTEAVALFALERQAGRIITAMIFDLTVPGERGGLEIIEEIRKLDPQVPVFVVSGYAEDPVIAHPVDYGFTDSLCKPFKVQELADILDRNLRPV